MLDTKHCGGTTVVLVQVELRQFSVGLELQEADAIPYSSKSLGTLLCRRQLTAPLLTSDIAQRSSQALTHFLWPSK